MVGIDATLCELLRRRHGHWLRPRNVPRLGFPGFTPAWMNQPFGVEPVRILLVNRGASLVYLSFVFPLELMWHLLRQRQNFLEINFLNNKEGILLVNRKPVRGGRRLRIVREHPRTWCDILRPRDFFHKEDAPPGLRKKISIKNDLGPAVF